MISDDDDECDEQSKGIYTCLVVGILTLYAVFLFGMAFLLLGIVVVIPFLVLGILNGLLVLNIEYTFFNWIKCAIIMYTLQRISAHVEKLYGKRY